MPRKSTPNAGYWIYNSLVLRIYDWVVPGILNRFVWRCPTSCVRSLFNEHLSARHADIGIGTGFFLAHAYRARGTKQQRHQSLLGSECFAERLILLDAHPATLNYCETRLQRLGVFAENQIETHEINVTDDRQLAELAAIIGQNGMLDSVSANYLFHCLPNGLQSSEPSIAFAKQVLAKDGVFFGSMILAEQTDKRLVTKTIAGLFRRLNIFGRRKDRLSELRGLLNKHFEFCDIQLRGCVAVFVAKQKHQ